MSLLKTFQLKVVDTVICPLWCQECWWCHVSLKSPSTLSMHSYQATNTTLLLRMRRHTMQPHSDCLRAGRGPETPPHFRDVKCWGQMCLRTGTSLSELGFVKGLPKCRDTLAWTHEDLSYLCAMIPQPNSSIHSFTRSSTHVPSLQHIYWRLTLSWPFWNLQ